MFGRSITRPAKPRSKVTPLEATPGLPVRPLALALIAVVAAAYAVVRHYAGATQTPPRGVTPTDTVREIPAPELVPLTR